MCLELSLSQVLQVLQLQVLPVKKYADPRSTKVSCGTEPHDILLIVQTPPMISVNRFAQPARALRDEGLQAPYSPGETSRSMIGATNRGPKE